MAHDVFISYSSENKSVANEVLTTLENKEIRCWIAPRDIPPGKLYGASLINAIKSAQIMVLVLSNGTNHSEYVVRELNEAVANGLTIISFRIEEVEPSENLGFYINSTQWLDAIEPPMENHLNKLADSVEALLSVSEGDQPPVAEAIVVAPEEKRSPMPTWAYALIGLIVVTILIGFALWIVPRLNSTDSSSSATLASADTESTGTSTDEKIQLSEPVSNLEWSDWRELTFNVPNEVLWSQSEDGSYTAHAQDRDTFAWSDEIVEGDLILNLEITTLDDSDLGYIVVYGDGGEFSPGNLIIQIESVFAIVKDTIYVGGDAWLAEIPSNMKFQPGQTYNVSIEVIDDLVNLSLDDRKVASARIDDEVNRIGKIGLMKYWNQDEVTFSNIRVKTRFKDK